MHALILALALALTLTVPAVAAPPASFPGAQGSGYAAIVNCDRSNPQLLTVTSLATTGLGTLNQAFIDMDTNPTRIKFIKFDVAGNLFLLPGSTYEIPNRRCWYLAGQTAPGSGITIRSTSPGAGNLHSRGDAATHETNYVVRYIRLRGYGAHWIIWRSGGDGIMTDHISSTWGGNSCGSTSRNHAGDFNTGLIQNVTHQYWLCGESLSSHPVGLFTGSELTWAPDNEIWGVDYHHNLFVSVSHRIPLTGTMRSKVINNVVYNWNQKPAMGTYDVANTDWINNYFKVGPRNAVSGVNWEITGGCNASFSEPPTRTITGASNTSPIRITTSTSHGFSTGSTVTVSGVNGNSAANGTWVVTTVPNSTGSHNVTLNGSSGNGTYSSGGTAKIVPTRAFSYYAAGNIGPHNSDPNADNWTGASRMLTCFGADNAAIPSTWLGFETRRFTWFPNADVPITIQTAQQAYDTLVTDGDVGANKRLACNGDWVSNQDSVDTRLLNDARNGTGPNTIPTSAGTYPTVDPGFVCQVSGGDGIPDEWKDRYGLVRTTNYLATIGANDYLYIEHYLNGTSPFAGTPPPPDPPADACLETTLCVAASFDNTDTATYVTASVAPVADAVYELGFFSIALSGAAPEPTSVAGWGATWTQQNTGAVGSIGAYRLTTFRALTGSAPSSGALTISLPSVQAAGLWVLMKVPSGGATGGTNGADAVAQSEVVADGISTSTITVPLAAFQHPENGTLMFAAAGGPRQLATAPGFTTIANVASTDVTGRLIAIYNAGANQAPSVSWDAATTVTVGIAMELATQAPAEPPAPPVETPAAIALPVMPALPPQPQVRQMPGL